VEVAHFMFHFVYAVTCYVLSRTLNSTLSLITELARHTACENPCQQQGHKLDPQIGGPFLPILLSPPFPPLPCLLSSPFLSSPFLPSLFLPSPQCSYGVWESTVSFPSRVWGRGSAANIFCGYFKTRKCV